MQELEISRYLNPIAEARQGKALPEGSQHVVWRNSRNATEPAEILHIGGEQVPDSMHVHCCHQASVVDLDP